MTRGIYTVNRNMNILQKKQENLNTNFANVKTPGYKFQHILQTTMESSELINFTDGANNNRRRELGPIVFGNEIDEYVRNFQQGIVTQTESQNDYAIVGEGFFTIQMGNGQIGYTRNGNFMLDDNNQLVTMDGDMVLMAGDRPLISDFNDYQQLVHMGNAIFTGAGAFTIDGELQQGFLEMSNVNIADEMVKMIEVAREFEANQKLLHAADETLTKAVNDIGRV